jgi:hypothetical protein
MKKTRIIGRIAAGAAASALLLSGALAVPAQAKDSDSVSSAAKVSKPMLRDTGWGSV